MLDGKKIMEMGDVKDGELEGYAYDLGKPWGHIPAASPVRLV